MEFSFTRSMKLMMYVFVFHFVFSFINQACYFILDVCMSCCSLVISVQDGVPIKFLDAICFFFFWAIRELIVYDFVGLFCSLS